MTDRFKWLNPDTFITNLENNLLDMMRSASLPPAKRGDAVASYLEGQGFYWPNNPNTEAEARAIAAQRGRKVPMSKLKVPKVMRHANDEAGRWLSIMRDCSALEAALADPNANGAAKLNAIEKWFQTMGWLAPDELRASVAQVTEAANVSP